MAPPYFSVVICVSYRRKTTEFRVETGDVIETALKIIWYHGVAYHVCTFDT